MAELEQAPVHVTEQLLGRIVQTFSAEAMLGPVDSPSSPAPAFTA